MKKRLGLNTQDRFVLAARSKEEDPIFKEINIQKLLDKFGPEGLYNLAQRLLDIANEDISDSIDDIHGLYDNK